MIKLIRKGLVLISIFSLTATFPKVKAQTKGLAYGTDEIENEITPKVGLNLPGGVEFDIDAPLKPSGQLGYSITDTLDQLVILAGLRFPLNF